MILILILILMIYYATRSRSVAQLIYSEYVDVYK